VGTGINIIHNMKTVLGVVFWNKKASSL